MIAIIDNYDSFTYNLVQLLGEMGKDLNVLRNDVFTIEELTALAPEAIVISPGPGTPQEAGLTMDVIRSFSGKVPILGVCLGHQAIGACFGAVVERAPEPVHGKASDIFHSDNLLFEGVSNPFKAGRYHSLIIRRDSLPECLEVIAETNNGLIMAVKHRDWPVYGVQFHPESVITSGGRKILENFLRSVSFEKIPS